MEIPRKLSTKARSFIQTSINKIFMGDMVYCSTAKDGMEIWHETVCKYTEDKLPGVACKNFMESEVHRRVIKNRTPRFENDLTRSNFAMAVFDFNKTHLVIRTDNKQFNFELESDIKEEMIDLAVSTGRYAVFTPLVALPSPKSAV